MKNTLAENMLRFKVKNLTVEQTAALAQGPADPQWITNTAQRLVSIMGELTIGYKPKSSYVTKYTNGIYARGASATYILPKGTKWDISPSGLFLTAKCKRIMSANFGYGTDSNPILTALRNPQYCAEVVSGKKMGTDGKPVIFKDVFCLVSPHNQSAAVYMADMAGENFDFKFVNYQLGDELNKLSA